MSFFLVIYYNSKRTIINHAKQVTNNFAFLELILFPSTMVDVTRIFLCRVLLYLQNVEFWQISWIIPFYMTISGIRNTSLAERKALRKMAIYEEHSWKFFSMNQVIYCNVNRKKFKKQRFFINRLVIGPPSKRLKLGNAWTILIIQSAPYKVLNSIIISYSFFIRTFFI